jgi:hypothetical protein
MITRIDAVLALSLLAACGGSGGGSSGPTLPACPATDQLLTASPLADADFTVLTPLGNLNPPGHVFPTEHQYFYLAIPPGATVPAAVAVVTPGDLTLIEARSSEHLSADPQFTDWDLTLAACDGLSFRFGHVATLAPAVEAALVPTGSCDEYSTGGQDYRQCRYTAAVPLLAGAPLGTAGGNAGQYALDLGTHDTRKPPVGLVNAAAYGDAAYARCVTDYAAADVQAALLAHVERTVEPRCGSQAQDVAGTAQGNWRRAGEPTYPEDPHLALVHDPVDPSRIAISIGTSLGISPRVASPTTEGTGSANRDPSEAVPGTTWCWDLGGSRLVVELPTASTLTAEAQTGACGDPPWTLGAGAVQFVR